MLSRGNKHSMSPGLRGWLAEQEEAVAGAAARAGDGRGRLFDAKSILQVTEEKEVANFNVWYWAGGRIQQLLVTVRATLLLRGQGQQEGPVKKATPSKS